jgi:4,5-dihydroxyphthalate decarboxylase
MSFELPLVVRGYDGIYPLYRGDVATPGLDLKIDHRSSIDTLTGDDPPPAGEMSSSKYLLHVASGGRTWVGVPVYLIRGFRQRSFWVPQGSALTSLDQLSGASIGLSGWPDSGNVWARAALREAGVGLADVRWRLGPPNPDYPRTVGMPTAGVDGLDIGLLEPGDALVQAGARGDLDAVSIAFPPRSLFTPDAPLRRLYPSYATAERGYFERTGVYPVFHVLVVRRDVVEARPQVLGELYDAFATSWRIAHDLYRTFGDATPWMQAGLEDAERLLGAAAQPFGISDAVHRRSIETLSIEQHAQGLVDRTVDADEAFADFLRLTDTVSTGPAPAPVTNGEH